MVLAVSGQKKPATRAGYQAWRGRKLAGITQLQAPALNKQGTPLIGQQRTNPPEPLSGNGALHPPLESLGGQPDAKTVGENEADAQEQATRLAQGYAPVHFGSREQVGAAVNSSIEDRHAGQSPRTSRSTALDGVTIRSRWCYGQIAYKCEHFVTAFAVARNCSESIAKTEHGAPQLAARSAGNES